jgi:1,4-dihydroxy-2-naphthoyl-CoA hydrolase
VTVEFPEFDPKVAERLTGGAELMTGLPEYLGMRQTEVGPGVLRAELDVRDELKTPFGNLHGGVLAALCLLIMAPKSG